MKNINLHKTDFIDKIIGIISLEKVVSKYKIAYKKDISLVFDWFEKTMSLLKANK